ncbi:uncharacterized protein F5891DRAFT_984471 [Suillus fuscotomentosus]|uniref:Uncharacterized protein n=1 Tax=Suillus fuscotomentosus TaxID=1912939 RepID=A0AAD4DVX6_9AGAM|nr:uncharacterized protein F5891DRAFT_984471 [Suillus fuscotomentosus]KAG1895148.1 hypothetical protein F5891DRAFT_984471 [Suillus fuscotomentosus]
MPATNQTDQEPPLRSKHAPAPSKKLTGASNTATPEISAHSEAVALKRAEDAKRASEQHQQCLPLPPAVAETSHVLPPGIKRSRDVSEADLSYHSSSGKDDNDSSTALKRPKNSEHTGSGSPSLSTTTKASKKKNKDAVDDSGFLADINVASLSNGNDKPRHENRGQDVDKFFSAKYSENGIDGKPRTYRDSKKVRINDL